MEGIACRRLVLETVLRSGDFPSRRLAASLAKSEFSGRDRALATEVLSGVLRRRRTLDAVFRPYSKRRTVEPAVLWTLRVALYQHLFLDQVPTYAAFHETLEAARPQLGKALPFVNAVLRAVERGGKWLPGEEASEEDQHRLPRGAGVWEFDRPILPSRNQDLAAYLGTVFSYPDFLVARWLEPLGETGCRARLQAGNRPPGIGLRPNVLRTRGQELEQLLNSHQIQVEPGPVPGSLCLAPGSGAVGDLPGFAQGWFSIQDPTSLATVQLASPKAGERVLDLCAAPGGKAFAAWELMGGRGELLACDRDAKRLARMEPEAARLGHEVDIRHLVQASGMKASSLQAKDGRPWDLVLLDVPCSNTGVLARRPEARWRFSAESLKKMVQSQKRLTRWALPAVLGPETRVLWCTCSLEPEENLQAAERAARRGGLQVAESRLFEPGPKQAGGFAALLVPSKSGKAGA
ncbi:MAG: hypothetical protein DWQ01_05650 [Planctomycetota bacterium]|nr:MAG: hypothetical protein DWQ01_05650 [Planctomycetota bacterium]